MYVGNIKIVFHNIQTWTTQKTNLILQHSSTAHADLVTLLKAHTEQLLQEHSEHECLQFVNQSDFPWHMKMLVYWFYNKI